MRQIEARVSSIRGYLRVAARPHALPAIRRAEASPKVLDLIEVRFWAIVVGAKGERPQGEPSHCLNNKVREDHPVTLRGDQDDAGVEELLLRVEDVERGALADPRL